MTSKRVKRSRESDEVHQIHGECCRILKFEEGGCKVLIPTGDRFFCISGTLYQKHHQPTGKLCDLILLASDLTGAVRKVCVAEAKGGRVDIAHIVDQLQAGAVVLEGIVGTNRREFSAVLVHRSMSTVGKRHLRRAKVQFQGRAHPIRLLKCGGSIEPFMR